ncbi:NAD(P)H-binding protein [Pseudonocardia endophytica]|uniref:Nucleoside-diphosphate-sugar epimerase n=1 Tax=Pseudonocardia endophytica TaxID=401976 RepID=A0A4R1I0N6_PSEEN|nr:NAD(P)H-binding protein [Pseudonocardia endophytica]TCK27451.1 nucleoside-diphosphate-sugar epimerase [Pseudonocardia endophytica]
MNVVIAGGHGQIALLLAKRLAGAGHAVRSLVRNPDHVSDVEATGASVAVLDMETASIAEVAAQLDGADAVVFAAGAGPGSTAERKDTVDRAAALLLADAAAKAGVRRYLLVSATGVDDEPDPERGEVWAAYIAAKKAAEDAIRADLLLDATILRPGRLTDEPATGKILLAPPPVDRDMGDGDPRSGDGSGTVTRDDTAAVLVALLESPGTAGQTLELRNGYQDVAAAVAEMADREA